MMGAIDIEELEPQHSTRFSVGGVSVRISSTDREEVTLVPSLLPFQVQTVQSDINIQISVSVNCAQHQGDHCSIPVRSGGSMRRRLAIALTLARQCSAMGHTRDYW